MSTSVPPLRLMVFDATCDGRGPFPALTTSWRAGAWVYRALGRLDAWHGAPTWADALEWLANVEPERTIGEIQFWGHGNWGTALIDRVPLDVSALEPSSEHHARLLDIKRRLDPNGSLWWFRTCETFGTEAGQRFARAWADFFNCRVAGHTYVIWLAQSGLHSIGPGEAPAWSPTEGLRESESPRRARWSGLSSPNTISCFHGRVPRGY